MRSRNCRDCLCSEKLLKTQINLPVKGLTCELFTFFAAVNHLSDAANGYNFHVVVVPEKSQKAAAREYIFSAGI